MPTSIPSGAISFAAPPNPILRFFDTEKYFFPTWFFFSLTYFGLSFEPFFTLSSSELNFLWSLKQIILFLWDVYYWDSVPHSLCLIFMILISLENVKKYSHMVARLPQRLKSTLRCLKFFLHSGYPSGTLRSKKFQTTLILAFEANSALSRENETKIVKITHSVLAISFNNNCNII